MNKKNLFQSVKAFINKHGACTQFTTKELHDKMSGIESVTFWKRHSNEFYRTDTYRSYLKRLGFVKKIKNGLWEVIAPIPDWFDSGTANFLLFPAYKFENGKTIRQYHYKGEIRSVIEAKLEEYFKHYNQIKEIIMTNPKFKVGDKVKILSNDSGSSNKIGDIGTIIEIQFNMCFKVYCKNVFSNIVFSNIYHSPAELELVTVIEEKSKYKVGDYVKIIKNTCNHGFHEGEIVKVESLDDKGKVHSCKSISDKISGKVWLIDEEEIVPTSEIPLPEKPKPCALTLKVESSAKELAKELVGDGKTPNVWFVTYGAYIMVREDFDCSDNELLEGYSEKDSETFGPFYSYQEACDKYDDIDLDPHDGIGQVFIEDRLIGTVKEKYLEKVIKVDYSYNEHDDSKFYKIYKK